MPPRVILIAVVSADGCISKGAGVPWDLPADKAHFRASTHGIWLLLGHRTYQEMLGWFQPGDTPLVLVRPGSEVAPPGKAVTSVQQAVDAAAGAGQAELVAVGGSAVFDAAMSFADRLVITHVHQFLGGGVPFPAIPPGEWEAVSRVPHGADVEHAVGFEIVTYQRIQRLERAA